MLEVFFHIQGTVNVEFIPEGTHCEQRTRHSASFTGADPVEESKIGCWEVRGPFVWQRFCSFPPHLRLPCENVNNCYATSSILPKSRPCDFNVFPERANSLQGCQYESADEVKTALQAELKNMTKNGFQTYFDDLYKRITNDLISKDYLFQHFNW